MSFTSSSDTLVCGVAALSQARDVVAFAGELAERLSLRLRLVHSVHPDVFVTGDRRRALLREGAEALDALVADRSAERIVELGDPIALLEAVLDEGAYLAVLGSRGRGPARAALAGSVSNVIADSARCPVVIVPPHASTALAAHPMIVCGVDGSQPATAALAHASELAGALDGGLLAVHVSPGALVPHATSLMPGRQPFSARPDEARVAVATLERPLAELDIDVPVNTRVETGIAAARLAAVAAEEPGSLLAVGSRGHGPLRSAVFGSTSASLASGAPVPVMIVGAAAQA
jgi:nucleotide-binding universal stress UspA family protein